VLVYFFNQSNFEVIMIPDCPVSMQSESPRVTLGQQILEKRAKASAQDTQTVRDTTNAMGEEYMKSLWTLVKKHENLSEDWFITEIITHDTFLEGVMKVKHIARRTRPNPEWGLALYKVHPKSGTLSYEWGLPHVEEAIHIMKEPEGWDKKIVKDIMAFANGTLE